MDTINNLIKQAETAFENAEYEETRALCLDGINKVEKSKDTKSIKATIKFLNILSDCDLVQGKFFNSSLSLERIIKLAEEHKYPVAKAEAMINMGTQLSKSGKWEKANVKFEEAKKIVEKFENPYLLGLTLGGLGEIYFRTGKVKDAIAAGQKMIEIGEKIDNQILIGQATNIIMISWHGIGKLDLALEFNLKTIDAYRKAGDNSKLGLAFNNRGEIYKALEEYEKALDSYKEGLDADENNIAINAAYVYPNMAECYVRLGQISEAKEAFEKAESQMKNSEDKYAVAYLWMVKGMIESLEGNEDEAIDWLFKAEKRMKSLNVPFDAGMIILEHSHVLTKYGHKFEGLMKMKEALTYFEQAKSELMIEKIKTLIENSKT